MPTDAGGRRMVALQHRAGVDITFLAPAVPTQEIVDRSQLFLNDFVIIITPGISRDATSLSSGRHTRLDMSSLKIIKRENNHRFRFRQNLLRIASLLCITCEVIHLAALAAIQPFPKLHRMFRSIGPRKAAKIKSQLPCQRYNLGTDIS